jgi:hypothetical protein
MCSTVKCIWHWKWKSDPYESDEYMKVYEKVEKAMKENPKAFPKMSPGIHHGRGVGFRLVEGNEEQLRNLVAIWAPVEEWKLEVYFEGDELSAAGRKWHPERF